MLPQLGEILNDDIDMEARSLETLLSRGSGPKAVALGSSGAMKTSLCRFPLSSFSKSQEALGGCRERPEHCLGCG